MDKPFHPKEGETLEDWHARLAAMDPVCLSCHQRERRKVWLETVRAALRKARKGERASRGQR
jgi:hypothetical protein